MKKITVLVLSILLCISAEAQKRKINKIAEKIASNKPEDAQELLNDYKAKYKEDAAYLYFQVKKNRLSDLSKSELLACFRNLQTCELRYRELDPEARDEYCKELKFCENSAAEDQKEIFSQYWGKIRRDRLKEEVYGFLSEFPRSVFEEDAIRLRNELEFELIRNSQNPEDFTAYLKSFPGSVFKKEAEKKIEELHYSEAEKKNEKPAYQEFIDKFPQSSLAARAKDRILDLDWLAASVANDSRKKREFLREYPGSKYQDLCRQMLAKDEWAVIKSSEKITELEEWQKEFSDLKEGADARQKISELKNIALPYLTRERKFCFYNVAEKTTDFQNEYSEISPLADGKYLVKKNGLYGIADARGTIKLNPEFIKLIQTKSGLIGKKNGNYYFLDKNYNEKKSLNYTIVEYTGSEFYRVWNLVNNSRKCGIINSGGVEIIPVKYDYISVLDYAFLLYTKGKLKNLCNLTDTTGTVLAEKIEIAEQVNSFFIIQKEEKEGLINSTGKMIVPASYKYIDGFACNHFQLDNKRLINYDGKELYSDESGNSTIVYLDNLYYAISNYGSEYRIFNARNQKFLNNTIPDPYNLHFENGRFLVSKSDSSLTVIDLAEDRIVSQTTFSINSEDFGGDGYPEPQIYSLSSEDFDLQYKPDFYYDGGVYVSGANPVNNHAELSPDFVVYAGGNQILIDKKSGKIRKVFEQSDVAICLPKGYVIVRSATDGSTVVYDSSGAVFRDDVIGASPLMGHYMVLETSGGTRDIFDVYTEKMITINTGIIPEMMADNYSIFTYKDIRFYQLYDGKVLYDKMIDFRTFDANEKKTRAFQLMNEKQYPEALRNFQDYLQTQPESPEISLQMAICYRELEQPGKALELINKIIAASANFNEEYLKTRISINKLQENFSIVAEDYIKLAENSEYDRLNHYANAMYYYNLADMYSTTIQLTARLLSEYKSKEKNNPLAYIHFCRGEAFSSLNNPAFAVICYVNASNTTTEDEDVKYKSLYLEKTGLEYQKLRDNDNACIYLKKACNLGRCSNVGYCR